MNQQKPNVFEFHLRKSIKMRILKCDGCSSYGLDEVCGCGGKRINPKPPKYSPEDKYAAYRRKAKYAGE